MRNGKTIITVTAVTLIVVFAGFYIYHQTSAFIQGPKITVDGSKPGPVSESFFTLSGSASQAAFLSLNGNQIYTDEKGHFAEKLLLLKGYNIIQIRAKDKFGREAEETFELVYNPPLTSSSTIQ